ncbi:NmrA family NAD(P)-binding protein [Nocardia higoensis]|uniref:NmrA family NAD(P)-binding protein n=1 Tax=Nocardia higoensis TaxID=228599 RepID=A0ABS0DAR6_9NOCA|nr:NmrA family NAD(P)-binding protein [Nocardia higoensis]MBF6354722.1 NmrA family NAD(P)-binding protein [Nocardia higoensis]
MSTHHFPESAGNPQNAHGSILVTGATGKQGGATARTLLARGTPVRVLVRDPHTPAATDLAAAGAQLVTGDFDAPDTLEHALAGVTGTFLIPPATYGPDGWDVDREATRGENFVAAAQRAGVAQIVFSGVAALGADDAWGSSGKQRIEEAIAASGLTYTLLRPVRFMENYLLRDAPVDGIHHGVHRHLFPADQPMKMIALADIADIAALAFAAPERFHARVLPLAGDAVAPSEAAAAISRATGHPVDYQEMSRDEAAALGPMLADTWQRIRDHGGWVAEVEETRAVHPGLRSFDAWLAESGAQRIKAVVEAEPAERR